MRKRVVVAMSGGVDSSVAAALLKRQGYEVIGITMCFSAYGGSAFGGNLPDSTAKRPTCCGIQGIEDARRVAHELGIKHYVLNFNKVLQEKVIKDFCWEYLKGRTPNPCVRCNQYIKFGALLKKAFSLDAKYLATGHYARIEKIQKSTLRLRSGLMVSEVEPSKFSATNNGGSAKNFGGKNQNYLLKKAVDLKKDQSYFLYRLSQNQLKAILFPLGEFTKDEVRKIAREFALPVADKLASQEICFLPDADYRRFLKTQISAIGGSPPKADQPTAGAFGGKTDIKPGPIVDKENNILGQHKGIAFYTIGQREGLGIARGYPLYVIKINPKNNCITVGKKEEVYADEFFIKDAHFILKPRKKKVVLRVRIRYNHPEAPARVMFFQDKIKIKFEKPQFAITPGQSAVFYDKDIVLGGGIIDKVIR